MLAGIRPASLIQLCGILLFCHRSAKQALDWIHDTGDFYLSTHTQLGHNRDETESLLQEHNEFKASAKVSETTLFVVCIFQYCVFSSYD